MAKAKRQIPPLAGLTPIQTRNLVMTMIGSVSAEKMLGMQIDLNTKLRSGALSVGELEEFLNRRNPFGHNAELAKPSLLQYVGKFQHGGNAGKFKAKDFFKKDNSDGVKFSGFGRKFTSNFLQKVENMVPKGVLKAYKLLRESNNPAIITTLGDGHETYLGDLYWLLTQQHKGESWLLTHGNANIFYIRDVEGILWSVDAYGGGDDGWFIEVFSIGDRNGCSQGQVFSR